jgi:hypothetical protein
MPISSPQRWFDKVALSPSHRSLSSLAPRKSSPLRTAEIASGRALSVMSSVSTLFDEASGNDKLQRIVPLDRAALEKMRNDAAKAAFRAAANSNARIREAANRQRAKRHAQKKAQQQENESNRSRRSLKKELVHTAMGAKGKGASVRPNGKSGTKKVLGSPLTPKRKIRSDVTVARSPFSRDKHGTPSKRATSHKKDKANTTQTRKWKSTANSLPTRTFDETLIRRAAGVGDPYGVLGRNIFGSLKRI